MNEKLILKRLGKDFFEGLLKKNSNLIGSDRDNALGLMFKYNNIQEFYDEVYKAVPFPKFTTIEKLWEAILRNYFLAQFRAAAKEYEWEEKEVIALIDKIVKNHSIGFIVSVKNSLHTSTVNEIQKKYDVSCIV